MWHGGGIEMHGTRSSQTAVALSMWAITRCCRCFSSAVFWKSKLFRFNFISCIGLSVIDKPNVLLCLCKPQPQLMPHLELVPDTKQETHLEAGSDGPPVENGSFLGPGSPATEPATDNLFLKQTSWLPQNHTPCSSASQSWITGPTPTSYLSSAKGAWTLSWLRIKSNIC